MTSPSAPTPDLRPTNHRHIHQCPSWTPSHPTPYYQGPLPGGSGSCGSSQKGRWGVAAGTSVCREGRLPQEAQTQDRALLEDGDCVGRSDRKSTDTGSVLGECVVDPISDPRRRMRRRELSQFSPEEADRILRRRERNKVAATKCRHKRHSQHEHLVKELQGMECENTSLTYEIRQLQRQRQALSDVLRHHQMSCSSHLQFNPVDVPAENKMPPGGLSGPYPLPYTR